MARITRFGFRYQSQDPGASTVRKGTVAVTSSVRAFGEKDQEEAAQLRVGIRCLVDGIEPIHH